MTTKYTRLLLDELTVVCVLAGDADLNHVYITGTTPPQSIDAFELLMDKVAINTPNDPRFQRLLKTQKPLIFTPRDVSEGGSRPDWTAKDRRRLYHDFLPYVAAIDIELSKVDDYKEVIAQAKQLGVAVILSHHDFAKTPTFAQMIELAVRCVIAGGDVLKLAVNLRSKGDVAEFADAVDYISTNYPIKVTSMGTDGQLGQHYRMIDALTCGCIIYGYLTTPLSTGMIKASRIKQLLRELK
ncbi:MAG: type I 3-dehydroquinate dehydratase [Patescibacteria group bacterium]